MNCCCISLLKYFFPQSGCTKEPHPTQCMKRVRFLCPYSKQEQCLLGSGLFSSIEIGATVLLALPSRIIGFVRNSGSKPATGEINVGQYKVTFDNVRPAYYAYQLEKYKPIRPQRLAKYDQWEIPLDPLHTTITIGTAILTLTQIRVVAI